MFGLFGANGQPSRHLLDPEQMVRASTLPNTRKASKLHPNCKNTTTLQAEMPSQSIRGRHITKCRTTRETATTTPYNCLQLDDQCHFFPNFFHFQHSFCGVERHVLFQGPLPPIRFFWEARHRESSKKIGSPRSLPKSPLDLRWFGGTSQPQGCRAKSARRTKLPNNPFPLLRPPPNNKHQGPSPIFENLRLANLIN